MQLRIILVQQRGSSRLSSKIHDLTNSRKLAKFLVLVLLLVGCSSNQRAICCHQHVSATYLPVSWHFGYCCASWVLQLGRTINCFPLLATSKYFLAAWQLDHRKEVFKFYLPQIIQVLCSQCALFSAVDTLHSGRELRTAAIVLGVMWTTLTNHSKEGFHA